ncbi:MAG TPA: hypothetical protein VN549_05510, partial [Negativicutes bacterium]|nr:hypothetical protein [Negativicutes bacterium]
MFSLRRKKRKTGGGNKATFITILLVLCILFVYSRTAPAKDAAYPDVIGYNGSYYQYAETVKGSPFMYHRSRPAGAEGYLILTRRGVSKDEEVFIYEGTFKYRRYT